jgi:hypothetical protein
MRMVLIGMALILALALAVVGSIRSDTPEPAQPWRAATQTADATGGP